MKPLCFEVTDDDELFIGVLTGIAKYNSYTDDAGSYGLQYFSHPLSFGDSSRLKFLKKVNVTTFSGENSNVTLNWAYDYRGDYRVGVYALPDFVAAQYNISEFNTTAEYSSNSSLINTQKVNTGGSGSVVQIGVTTTINGTEIAFQELNIQSTIGRIN